MTDSIDWMTSNRRAAMIQTSSTQATLDKLATMRRQEAEAAHTEYPQYRGHWDGWRIAEVITRIRTKLGVAFEAGDLVLVALTVTTDKVAPRGRGPVAYVDWPEKQFATAYSFRNKVDTAVPVGDVREVRIVGGAKR